MSDIQSDEQISGNKKCNEKKVESMSSYEYGNKVYNVGDNVYIESQRSDMPYYICSIRDFKRSKKDNVAVDVVWYYRPCEIPTSVYQLLLQDRNAENGSSDHVLENPIVKNRELFISDAIDVFPASALRGHANCCSFSEVKENILEYINKENNWFYILRYNPESRRMANAKGEIRIGASHQAILPPYVPISKRSKAELTELDQLCKEELVWEPSIPDSRFTVFLRAARSITSYNGYCNSGDGSAEKAINNALSDDTNMAYSFDTLHKNNYNISEALQYLIKNPSPKVTMTPWTDDERKKFMKGLRSYGKVFHKIRRELLPERPTSEIIQYYYIWKKTTIALNSRPHKRGGRRNNQLVRKTRTTKPKAAAVSEFLDLSSCSENEIVDCEGSDDNKDFRYLYACRHCYSTKSPNWHHAGKDKLLLCYSCRMYFKRYGRMKPLKDDEIRDPPPFIYKAAFENLEDTSIYSGRMRTRRSSTPISSSVNSIRNRILQEASRLSNRKQITTPTIPQTDETEKPASVKRKMSPSDEESEESKKTRIAMEEEQAEDADDESEGDSDSGNTCNGQVTGESSRSHSPTDKNDTIDTNNDIVESPPTSTFVPIKVEEREDENENMENIDPPSSPDIPDDFEISKKVAERFKHYETMVGNSCSRCERVYIFKRQKKQKPVESENPKRREEVSERPRLVETSKYDGNSSHQPAQITSHYEAMRLWSQQKDQQRYWRSYHGPPEMHGHRSVSPNPRDFVVDSKYAQLLKEDRVIRDHVSPRTPNLPGCKGLSGHAFPARVPSEHSRDFRIPHPDHNRVSPPHPHSNIDSLSRFPHGVNSIGSNVVPPIERPTVDPITGLPTFQPHLHSHLHTHTHLHVHPDDIKYRGHLPESHNERLERSTPHHIIPPHQHPPHRPSSTRDLHNINLLMHHDPHIRESVGRSIPPSVRESPLPPSSRDGAGSPSFPHEIPNMHSDPVAYHLMVTQFARMHERMNSHASDRQGHVQAPDLSPHGMPGPPPHHHPHLRSEHDKHLHEKLLLVQAEREKLARADQLISLEHEKHMRHMLPTREHLEPIGKIKSDHPLLERASSCKPPGDLHSPYPSAHYLDNLRRGSHDTRPGSERNFHDRFAQERLERERIAHFERIAHPERFDRSRHDRPSIFSHYKPETIDLSED